MLEFLAGGDSLRSIAHQVSTEEFYPLSAVKLLAPVPVPGDVVCIGPNYRDHGAEAGLEIPTFPVVFSKSANTVIADGEAIRLPRVSSQVDYEAELGVVIGKRGRYISEAAALDYVAGYTAINDVSARDYQNRTSQWTMGKTFDTFAPMGPALVTTDEVPDPHNLSIRLTLNGETLQDSNTCNMIFNIPQLVASLSEVMTLEPGDIISTGTPPGVGMARTPQRWLRPGDSIAITIQQIGTQPSLW